MRACLLRTCLSLAGLSLAGILAALPAHADATRIGSVDTTFKLLGRNDRIVVDRYDDPRVDGVSCYVSRADTGGVRGSLGLASDPNRFSIACRATGHVAPKGKLPDSEVVFNESTGIFFKELRVTRMIDRQRNVLIYLVWSTVSLGAEGSPYNSISTIEMTPVQ